MVERLKNCKYISFKSESENYNITDENKEYNDNIDKNIKSYNDRLEAIILSLISKP